MANNHLRRLATRSITITLIIVVAILTSALPSVSMEGSGVLGSTNQTWNASDNFGNTAPVNGQASVPVTTAHSVHGLKEALPSHTSSQAINLTTDKTDEQFTNLPSSSGSGRGPAQPRLLTVYSSIEDDNQQQQSTDPSSELPNITGGPYPPPGMAPKITEVDAAYLASTITIARAAGHGGTHGT